MTTWQLWLLVFVIAACLDYVWSFYTRALVSKHALSGSLWAAVLAVLIGFNTIGYTENHWLLIPAASGSFVGTYLATR
jgi:hypothetical protein